MGAVTRALILCAAFGCVMAAVQSAQLVAAACVIIGVAFVLYRMAQPVRAVYTSGSHGTDEAAEHEGGHAALVKAAGGTVLDARIFPDGSGYTKFRMPSKATVVDQLAVDVAGEVATGTSRGCESDHAYRDALLGTLPSGERSAAKKAGYDRASNVLGGFFGDGGASHVANRLKERGRL